MIDPNSAEGVAILFVVMVIVYSILLLIMWAYDKVMTWFEMGGIRSLWNHARTAPYDGYAARTAAPPQKPVGEGMPVLGQRDWLDLANNRPDVAPHLLIVGKSGSGKTTLARAILAARIGEVAIITPKAEDAPAWGMPVTTLDEDASFTTIAATLTVLYRALLKRTASDQELTIVLDDYTILANDRQCKDACTQLVQAVARLGRSKRVRLLLLTHETTAGATATHGQHAVLENFTRIDCERYTHRATLIWDDVRYALDTRNVVRLAQRGLGHLEVWQAAPMAVPVRTGTAGLGDAEAVYTGMYQSVPPDTGTPVPPDEPAMIRALLDQGFSKNAIAKLLGGSKSTAYERIKQASEGRE